MITSDGDLHLQVDAAATWIDHQTSQRVAIRGQPRQCGSGVDNHAVFRGGAAGGQAVLDQIKFQTAATGQLSCAEVTRADGVAGPVERTAAYQPDQGRNTDARSQTEYDDHGQQFDEGITAVVHGRSL